MAVPLWHLSDLNREPCHHHLCGGDRLRHTTLGSKKEICYPRGDNGIRTRTASLEDWNAAIKHHIPV